MPIIEASDPSLDELKGNHLWHAGMSSCSQRVRIALAEAQVSFESHLINLHAHENASKAYQKIHPKGLVPAFLSDGQLLIESIDIIDFVYHKFGHRTGFKPDAKTLEETLQLMQLADRSQPDLKLLTFEFLFRAVPPAPAESLEFFFQNHQNDYLKQFYRDFITGFPRTRIDAAVNACNDGFHLLDKKLRDGRQWLTGDHFSLADIAWMPNFHRFQLIGWPFDHYPELSGWFKRAAARPSYLEGLVAWEPEGFVEMVSPKLTERRLQGRGVETYGHLAQ